MFIVISYLGSGYNTACGCVMEEWQSDLEIEEFDTREEAAKFIVSEEARQAKERSVNEPYHKEYMVIEGKSISDLFGLVLRSADETLDILLEGSVDER